MMVNMKKDKTPPHVLFSSNKFSLKEQFKKKEKRKETA